MREEGELPEVGGRDPKRRRLDDFHRTGDGDRPLPRRDGDGPAARRDGDDPPSRRDGDGAGFRRDRDGLAARREYYSPSRRHNHARPYFREFQPPRDGDKDDRDRDRGSRSLIYRETSRTYRDFERERNNGRRQETERVAVDKDKRSESPLEEPNNPDSEATGSVLDSFTKAEGDVKFLTKAQREKLRQELHSEDAQKRQQQERLLEISRQEFFNKEARAREEDRKRRQAEIEANRRLKEEQRRRREIEEQKRLTDVSGDDPAKTKDLSKRKKVNTNVEESSFLDDTTLSPEELRLRQEELEKDQIREHYLGMKKEKKKVQKPSEKFRNIFQFDWDGAEDTTRGDSNILYHKRHEPQLLFGRGFRAGVDVREQRRKNGFYDSLSKLRREKLSEIDPSELNEQMLQELSVTKIMGSEQQPIIMRDRDLEDEDVSTHWSVKTVEEMSDRDWRILREDFSIYVRGGRVPNPMRQWSESGLSAEILAAVCTAGYEKPTPIQMQAIPIAMEMKDMIGIAETGSGKTAAFMLPMIHYVQRYPRMNDETAQLGPHGLVLAPSRELAIQIREETVKFAANLNIKTVVLVGGRAPELQAVDLRKGAEIVIGTPGRIKDCLEKAYTVLIQCDYVVLDEADRMIDLGFEEVVNWILDQIPSSNMKSQDENDIIYQEIQARAGERRLRVTQMFSATMPPSVERLAKKYLRQPAMISIGNPGAGKKSIEQRFEFISEGKKKTKLEELLEELGDLRIIVFVNQKKNADAIAKTLKRQGYGVVALHGGRSQDTRETSLDQFKTGEVNILVATDVAGRGLDVEDVHVVINLDMPKEIEAYTHRIGRTGRAGKKGLSISFVTEEDSPLFYDLKNLLVSSSNLVPLEIQNHPASKQKTPLPQS